MIAGCGRAGDFSGDPTAWITPIKALLTSQGLFVYFTVNPALPVGSDLYLYIDGEVRDRGTGDGELYEQDDLPLSVAVAAVAPGIGDSTYDPLCGSTVNKFSIELEELTEPLSVLTRNAGNGSMEVAWQRPVSGVRSSGYVDFYGLFLRLVYRLRLIYYDLALTGHYGYNRPYP